MAKTDSSSNNIKHFSLFRSISETLIKLSLLPGKYFLYILLAIQLMKKGVKMKKIDFFGSAVILS